MLLEGTVINGVVVLDQAEKLAEGTRVAVLVQEQPAPAQPTQAVRTAKEVLMQFAGCMAGVPSDLARNHDHYLHGTPKQ